MFDWLRRAKKPKRLEEQIWRDQAQKLAGLFREVRARQAQGERLLLVAHFAETHRAVAVHFEAQGCPCQQPYASDLLRPDTLRRASAPCLLLSESLPTFGEAGGEQDAAPTVRALVVERYPVRGREAALEAFLAALPYPSAFCYHASLDEPLLRRFLGDNTMAMMERLGWQEGTPISGSLLGKAIASAQERIEREARGDARAASAELWFQYNLPPR